MSELFHDCHRQFQDEFGTRRLADRQEEVIVHDQLLEDEVRFVESRDMLFMSTVDPQGHPTVSYKGGEPGFIRVIDGELVFPCYDGNGMFLSVGNAVANPNVGLLLVDFEHPRRLRIHGVARHDKGDAKAMFPGAMFVTRVKPTSIFVNCPRYVHRYVRVGTSRYVPDAEGNAPVAKWKRLEVVRDVVLQKDRRDIEVAGALSLEDYEAQVAAGEG